MEGGIAISIARVTTPSNLFAFGLHAIWREELPT